MKKDTSFRNILMLRMIPREPQTITADLLQEKLADQGYDIHLRTIQRDLNRYSLRFGIRNQTSEDSRANCWCWSRDAAPLDIPEMSPMTGLTFNLVESFLGRLIPRSVLNYMNPHFKRATHLLEKLKGSKWSGWTEKIQIVPRGLSLIPPEIDQSVYETVFEAVLAGRQLEITYQKRTAAQTTSYLLNPLGLVFNQEVIYLVATKYGKSEVQQFALHRMETAASGQQSAVIPDGFNLTQYVAEGAFHYRTSASEINLVADFEAGIAKHLYESRLTRNQTLTRLKSGKVRLSATIPNSSALKWWLLGFGDGVEVLEPKELREEFTEIFIKLSTLYLKAVTG